MSDTESMQAAAEKLFARRLAQVDGVYVAAEASTFDSQQHTNEAFSEKWGAVEQTSEDREEWKQSQFRWYLQLYGFGTEAELARFVGGRKVILDAGCGLGYKAAWFARMNRQALVVAMDYSDAIFLARRRYRGEPNMIFVKGDIAATPFVDAAFDFISCDQVLHHTESPPRTLAEFHRISAAQAVLNTYVYSKKGLPRELLDEHFRSFSKELSNQQIWELSAQLTQLGKTLSELQITIDVPDMPALAIKGGKQDLQRFIYWNFIKCFWNEAQGWDSSVAVNFDWYSPSNAFRYSRAEFEQLVTDAGFCAEYLHSEEACHTGRFRK
jgi:ubiquinone/menaquinone biosynthesis C-methylase UbiE